MKQTFIFLIQLTSLLVVANAQPIDPAIKSKFDKIIDSHFKSDEPGGTVLVAQRGKILYERGFGLANLELSVKMQPEMLFEIGS